MPRIWCRKTDRDRKSSNEIESAVKEVLQGSSIRSVAKAHRISFSALQRHVQKARSMPEGEEFSFNPNLVVRQIVSAEQESNLAHYLILCSKMHYGLSSFQTRQMRYKYAKALNLVLTEKQGEEEKLGREWLFGFLRRNPILKLRTPEATNLSRFNKFNVSKFFDNAEYVFKRHTFTANDVWNCDEIVLTTVHNPPKVIAQKGLKQVGQVTSGERGQLVTMCGFVNAAGNTVPPALIFPRQRNLDVLGIGAPSGSLILGHPSGWMTATNFLLVFKHFKKYVRCSKETPVVLFFDNHDSHVTIELIEEAKKSRVFLVTFPPHCSQRLQPLDVSVYGPLSARYNQACDEWMTSNAGRPITLYNIAELADKAYILAFLKQNIIKGFEKTGIWPINRNVFCEDDFLMSSVTDRPQVLLENQEIAEAEADDNLPTVLNESSAYQTELPEVTNSDTVLDSVRSNTKSCSTEEDRTMRHDDSVQRTSMVSRASTPVASTSSEVLPEHVVPYPKAPPRKVLNIRGRKPGRTRILTDTPEKMEIEETRKRKVSKLNLGSKNENLLGKAKKHTQKKQRKVVQKGSTSEENEPKCDSSDDKNFEPEDSNKDDYDSSLENLTPGDFLLVKFATKSSVVHYVGRLESEIEDKYEINFLRKRGRGFIFPNVLDISIVPKNDIVLKLPPPSKSGGSDRVFSIYSFEIDLSSFPNIR